MANIAQKTSIHWEVFFEGMPDWAIPLIKVVPLFYTDDEYVEQWNDLEFNYEFNYFWEKVDEKNYKLYLRLLGNLRDDQFPYDVPLYVDLSLWIINTNYRDSIQHNRGY